MTCFWDSIITSLSTEDFKLLGCNKKPTREIFIQQLKLLNTRKTSTKWQDNNLRTQAHQENYIAIQNYDIKQIYSGHLTSTCDSFLLLLCHVLNVNIVHRFLSTIIKYTVQQPRKTLYYKSSRNHFSVGN